MILVDGGQLNATSITIAKESNSSGLLEIGEGGAPGFVNAPTITGGAGESYVILAHNATGYQLDSQLKGTLGVFSYQGETIFTNANTYTGDTVIFGGTLRTQNTSALGTSPVSLEGGKR